MTESSPAISQHIYLRIVFLRAGHFQSMLTDLYIEVLLVNEELAHQVWVAWDAGRFLTISKWYR